MESIDNKIYYMARSPIFSEASPRVFYIDDLLFQCMEFIEAELCEYIEEG